MAARKPVQFKFATPSKSDGKLSQEYRKELRLRTTRADERLLRTAESNGVLVSDMAERASAGSAIRRELFDRAGADIRAVERLQSKDFSRAAEVVDAEVASRIGSLRRADLPTASAASLRKTAKKWSSLNATNIQTFVCLDEAVEVFGRGYGAGPTKNFTLKTYGFGHAPGHNFVQVFFELREHAAFDASLWAHFQWIADRTGLATVSALVTMNAIASVLAKATCFGVNLGSVFVDVGFAAWRAGATVTMPRRTLTNQQAMAGCVSASAMEAFESPPSFLLTTPALPVVRNEWVAASVDLGVSMRAYGARSRLDFGSRPWLEFNVPLVFFTFS